VDVDKGVFVGELNREYAKITLAKPSNLIVTGKKGTGKIRFKKYDDGWRIVN
jgi:hypothetical protein